MIQIVRLKERYLKVKLFSTEIRSGLLCLYARVIAPQTRAGLLGFVMSCDLDVIVIFLFALPLYFGSR